MSELRAPRRDPSEAFLDLPIEQGILLWCIRMRVVELKRGMDADKPVSEVLDMLGIPGLWPVVRRFVDALNEGCVRYVDVQCVCKTSIGADESALLDVLALAQAMRLFEATLMLRGFVTQAGAEAALEHAEGIGMAMAQAGRFLPEPEEPVRHLALLPSAGAGRCGGGTLH